MRLRFGARQGLRQKNPAVQAREAKPVLRAEHFQKQMITRVPARGKAELKMFQRKPAGYMEDLPPRPAPEIVFAFEGRPRRGEGDNLHPRPQAGLQIEREGFGQQRHLKVFRRGAQKRRGNDEVAQPPQFDDE